MADALVAMAERFLAHPPGDDETLHTADRFQVTVHVSAETLSDGTIDPNDPPETEDGSVVSAETARRLCCDTAIVPMLETANGEPLAVGRKTRTIPPAIRRALKRRDGGCLFPGCANTRFVDGHHITHWVNGGPTELGNLLLLCRFHHTLVHEGGYEIVRDSENQFVFRRPDGSIVPEVDEIRFRGFGALRRTPAKPRAMKRATRASRGVDSRAGRRARDGSLGDALGRQSTRLQVHHVGVVGSAGVQAKASCQIGRSACA
jgi:hypothetical protein